MDPIRILQVVPNMQAGGLESFIMNIYRNIDRSKVQFDFLVHYQKRCFFDDEIERLGGKIYRLSVREDNRVFRYIRDLNHFFREHPEYRVVHGHMPSLALFYLHTARKNGVPVRIIHSHNTNTEKTPKGYCKRLLLRFANRDSNVSFACSGAAGKFLFRRTEYTIIPNAIDTEKFRFDLGIRNQTRWELGLDGQFVVGHVGRFNTQKNHLFLLDIFSEIIKRNPLSVLLLIGKGETEDSVHRKTDAMGLGDYVRFLGVRSDMERLYQAMDVFVLPSLFEGLPVVGIEAQAAGLPCVFSNTISKEVKITDLVTFEPLTHSAKEWADRILSQPVQTERKDTSGSIIKAGYDIASVAKKMEHFYLEQYQKNGDL